ncbi:MAG: thiamine-phosphate pyrophosphorylase [Bacillota bacterium]
MTIIAHTTLRILDANLNRVREGMRVLEEIARMVFDEKELTGQLKEARHRLVEAADRLGLDMEELLAARDAANDVGMDSTQTEGERRGISGVALANWKRVQEGLRVLEEFGKLHNQEAANLFKELRFSAYRMEKSMFQALKGVSEYS